MPEIRIPAVLIDGEMQAIDREDAQVLVCKVEGEYHAVSNICTHANVRLDWGKLKGAVVVCPLHGARFDVTNGRCVSGPSKLDLVSYSVREDASDLVISIDEPESDNTDL